MPEEAAWRGDVCRADDGSSRSSSAVGGSAASPDDPANTMTMVVLVKDGRVQRLVDNTVLMSEDDTMLMSGDGMDWEGEAADDDAMAVAVEEGEEHSDVNGDPGDQTGVHADRADQGGGTEEADDDEDADTRWDDVEDASVADVNDDAVAVDVTDGLIEHRPACTASVAWEFDMDRTVEACSMVVGDTTRTRPMRCWAHWRHVEPD